MIKNDPVRGEVGAEAIKQALVFSSYTVATVPAVAEHKGRVIHVSDGNAGSPCLAYSDGTSWLRIAFGAAVAVV